MDLALLGKNGNINNSHNKYLEGFMSMSRKIVFFLFFVISLTSCSAQSQQSFTARLREIESNGNFSSAADVAYAASTHSLQTFTARLREIESNGNFSSAADVAYARSIHKL